MSAAHDRYELDELTTGFLAAFTTMDDSPVDLAPLRELFAPAAVITKTCGDACESMDLEAFIIPREALLNSGELRDFREWELRSTTTIFGDIAQRWLVYRKCGVLRGTAFTTDGAKSLQFVRTPAGWRIQAVIWDDERGDLQVPVVDHPVQWECTTERLRLRWVTLADAAFMHRLVNDPDWLRYIGDRDIHDEAAARAFIASRFTVSYHAHGFGLFMVEGRKSGEAMGICGLVKRDGLDGPDVGFALLPEFRGQGIAYEAAIATLELAHDRFGLTRILAITDADNVASGRLLEKLGLRFERMIQLAPEDKEIRLFAGKLPC